MTRRCNNARDVRPTVEGVTSTTKPVQASNAPDAEFCRPSDMRPRFGICRTAVYVLIEQGAIRSFVLRQPGKATGIRLIDVESVRQFLKSQMQQATNDARHGVRSDGTRKHFF